MEGTNMAYTIPIGAAFSYEEVKKINRNDIVAFNSLSNGKPTCLRVIGLPGDKIEIIKGQILINDQPFDLPNSSTSIYTVQSKSGNFSKLQGYDYKPYSEEYGTVRISKDEYNTIVEKKLVDSIYRLGAPPDYIFPGVVTVSTSKHFNHFYFGPVFIPKVGDTISQEDKMLIKGFADFSSDKKVIDKEFYFVVGDSFSDAMDSRIFGLIPKDKILGKATQIGKGS
jgi:signal peptidase I